MDPHKRFCHNERCWAYARAGEGHIVIHSRKERRYRCKRCGRTFSASGHSSASRRVNALWAMLRDETTFEAPPAA